MIHKKTSDEHKNKSDYGQATDHCPILASVTDSHWGTPQSWMLITG